MLKKALYLLSLLLLIGCGSKKRTYSKSKPIVVSVEGSAEETTPPKKNKKEERKNRQKMRRVQD